MPTDARPAEAPCDWLRGRVRWRTRPQRHKNERMSLYMAAQIAQEHMTKGDYAIALTCALPPVAAGRSHTGPPGPRPLTSRGA